MKHLAINLSFVVGAIIVAAGLWMLHPAAGLIGLGVMLMTAAILGGLNEPD